MEEANGHSSQVGGKSNQVKEMFNFCSYFKNWNYTLLKKRRVYWFFV
jgi:hypothetical protein